MRAPSCPMLASSSVEFSPPPRNELLPRQFFLVRTGHCPASCGQAYCQLSLPMRGEKGFSEFFHWRTWKDANPPQTPTTNQGGSGQGDLSAWPRHRQIGHAPSNADKDSNQRNIGVTVSHRLPADLHDSNHGNQGAQIPQPSHRKPGAFPEMMNAKIEMPASTTRLSAASSGSLGREYG